MEFAKSILMFRSRSTSSTNFISSFSKKRMLRPSFPFLAVRPALWTKLSRCLQPIYITTSMSSTSRPRAATSVPTKMYFAPPVLNFYRAFSLALCSRSPWIGRKLANSNFSNSRASCFVSVKIIIFLWRFSFTYCWMWATLFWKDEAMMALLLSWLGS